MSKYKLIGTQIKKKEYICAALDDMGIPYEVAPEGEELPLYGYRGDRRSQTGAIVVRRKHISSASNDLGWSFDAETGAYRVYQSEYDLRVGRANEIVNGVNQRCALLDLYERAGANGFTLEVVEDEAGVQRVLF